MSFLNNNNIEEVRSTDILGRISLNDGVFPNKSLWKKIICESTISKEQHFQRRNELSEREELPMYHQRVHAHKTKASESLFVAHCMAHPIYIKLIPCMVNGNRRLSES